MKKVYNNLANENLEQRPTIAENPPSQDLEQESARAQRIARLRMLWERRGFLFRATLIGMVAAAVIAFLIPKRYDSTARLMPPDDQSGGMALVAAMANRAGSGGLGALAGNLLGIRTTGDLFIGILKSRTMQDRLVDQFHLKEIYGASRSDQARRKLEENTAISSDRLSGIITLTVSDRDPKRAAQMASAYVDGLNSMVANLSTSSAHRERVFLEGRLTDVRQNLEEAENQFSQFASKNTAIDIPEQGKAMVTAAASLEGQLIAAESELEGLKQIYTDNNVRVRSTSARVGELRQELQKMGGEVKDSSSGPDGDGQLFPSIRKLPLLGVTYADLYRRMKVQEAVFEALTQEYELAKVEEAKEIPTVKILDSPNIPERKAFPPRMIIIVASGFLSLALAVAWSVGTARWAEVDQRDPAKLLALDVFTALRTYLPRHASNGAGQSAEGRLNKNVISSQREERNEQG